MNYEGTNYKDTHSTFIDYQPYDAIYDHCFRNGQPTDQ